MTPLTPNEEMSLPTIQRQAISRLVGPATALLVASMFLGLLYNSASPLGVRSGASAGTATVAQPLPGIGAALENETLSVSLVSSGAPRPSTRVYQNETISLSLVGALTAGTGRPAVNSPIVRAPDTAALPGRRIIPSVNWQEVKPLLAANQIVLVDARLAAHYQAGHIPGAVSLTAHSAPNEMAAFTQKYSKATPLVIYCGSDTCPMSHELAEALIANYGYVNVRVMPGGYAEYRLAETQSATTAGK